jgi:hypothetical protein
MKKKNDRDFWLSKSSQEMPLLPNTLRKQMCHSVERRRGVKMESWRSEETESSLGKKWSCDGDTWLRRSSVAEVRSSWSESKRCVLGVADLGHRS